MKIPVSEQRKEHNAFQVDVRNIAFSLWNVEKP